MKILDHVDLIRHLCVTTRQWVIYVTVPRPEVGPAHPDYDREWDECRKAIPWLDPIAHMQPISDGEAFIVCDSEEECDRLYGAVVGDNGPTKTNPYDGKYRAYALTCGPDGELMNENT